MAISVSFFYYEVQGVGVPKYIGTGIEVYLGGIHRTCVNENISPLLRVITVHVYSMSFSHFLLPEIMHVWVWVCMGVWQRQSFSKELKAFI